MQFLQWQDCMLSQNFLSKWLQGLFLTQSTNTIKIGAKFSSYQAANFGNWHQIKIVVYVGYWMCSDRNASGNFQLTRSVRGLKSLRLLPFLTSFLVGVNLPVHLLEENISTRNSTPGHNCWVHVGSTLHISKHFEFGNFGESSRETSSFTLPASTPGFRLMKIYINLLTSP